MKAVSLFCVFALAKAAMLAGREVPVSVWAPAAYLWQDALVAIAFAGVDWVFQKRAWVGWIVYVALVTYVIVNVPVARMMSGPLTLAMLRGARGTLGDSISHQVTVANVAIVGGLVLAAGLLPWLMKRMSRRSLLVALAAGVLLVIVGPIAVVQIETMGRHRNALAVLVTSAFPRVQARDYAGDWRSSPFEAEAGDDLSHLRGVAAGRNVVIVILESTGARFLRTYGSAQDPMPNLTRLAERAIVFERAYTVYPESIKGLFATFCSRYPAMDTRAEAYAKDRTPALPGVLAAAGYRTALFHSGRFSYLGMRSLIEGRGFQTMEDAGDIGGEHDSSFGVDEPSTVRRMLRWVDAVPRGEKFFLTYMPIAGHHPYEVPEAGPWPETSEENRYLNALHYGDRALGMLIDGLRERGLEEKTLFVIFGDHGEAFGEHDGNFGHTNFIYEENVRIPYLVVVPGAVNEPVRSRTMAGTIDTGPTVMDLLGVEAPAQWEGRSLLSGRPAMSLFFTDYSLGLVGLRDGRWKFIYSIESSRSSFFDLELDPHERHDLAAHHGGKVAAYREHLLRWAAAQRARLAGAATE